MGHSAITVQKRHTTPAGYELTIDVMCFVKNKLRKFHPHCLWDCIYYTTGMGKVNVPRMKNG